MARSKSVLIVPIMLSILILAVVKTSCAESGEFWYGLYDARPNGTWLGAVYDSMRIHYKMNWCYGGFQNQSQLNHAAELGLQVIVTGPPNLVSKYSAADFLRYEAEGDTTGYCFDPGGYSSFIQASGGLRVIDTAAENDSAWLFVPGSACCPGGRLRRFANAEW